MTIRVTQAAAYVETEQKISRVTQVAAYIETSVKKLIDRFGPKIQVI